MKKILIFSAIGLGLLSFGCQQGSYPGQTQQARPQPRQTYQDYSDWSGPGWYYGVYFNNEGSYNSWRSRRYGRRGSQQYYYPAYPRRYQRRWGRRDDRRDWRPGRRDGRRGRDKSVGTWRGGTDDRRQKMRDQQERIRRDREAQRRRR